MEDQDTSIYTQQINFRVTPREKTEFQLRAKQDRVSLGTWVRERLLAAAGPGREERNRLVLLALGNEINRLTLLALYDQKDISSKESQADLERKASASAEALVDRWLSLLAPAKGGA
ncbi:MAG: plasmid mobilization protein [Bryobacteraceae bacterium]|jgi:hypothetical protein